MAIFWLLFLGLCKGSLLSKHWIHHSIANLYTVLYCTTHFPQQQATVLGQFYPFRTWELLLLLLLSPLCSVSFNTQFFNVQFK